MIAHIEGKLVSKTPAYVVIDCNGVGYGIHISLQTFEKIKDQELCKLLTHLAIKEDSHTLFGFVDEQERAMFRHLISVNGVGTNTARMVLSAQSTTDIQQAIMGGNVSLLKSIKGIGPKTAQRMIIELQDKLKKGGLGAEADGAVVGVSNFQEALSALVMLGFSKNEAEKALNKIYNQSPGLNVEELVKNTLKTL